MITRCSAAERQRAHGRKRQAWLMVVPRLGFSPESFEALALFGEYLLSPGGVAPLQPRDASQVITYVHEGALAYEDATGARGVIGAGEFQRLTLERGATHTETNASPTSSARFFRVGLATWPGELVAGHQEQRFSAAQRRDVLCVVASPDGRRGSLRVHQDIVVCSAILSPGRHVVHELGAGRSAWLHTLQGELVVGDVVLAPGDGASVVGERSVSFTTRGEAEVLLIDVASRTNLKNGAAL